MLPRHALHDPAGPHSELSEEIAIESTSRRRGKKGGLALRCGKTEDFAAIGTTLPASAHVAVQSLSRSSRSRMRGDSRNRRRRSVLRFLPGRCPLSSSAETTALRDGSKSSDDRDTGEHLRESNWIRNGDRVRQSSTSTIEQLRQRARKRGQNAKHSRNRRDYRA